MANKGSVPKNERIVKRIRPSEGHLICVFKSTNGRGYSIDVIDRGFEYGEDFFGFATLKAAEAAARERYEDVKEQLAVYLTRKAEQRAKRKGKLVSLEPLFRLHSLVFRNPG